MFEVEPRSWEPGYCRALQARAGSPALLVRAMKSTQERVERVRPSL